MGKLLVLVLGYLSGPIKSVAAFFLSGGLVIFSVIGTFVGLLYTVHSIINGFSDDISAFLDNFNSSLSWLQNLDDNGFANMLKYCCAIDTLVSVFSSAFGIIASMILFCVFGVFSLFVGAAFPTFCFRVYYFIRKQIYNVS